MARKLISLGLLAAVAVPALLVTGCASEGGSQPYGLTGNSQQQVDQQHQEWAHRQQYTDQKGRYHPEWDLASREGGSNTPPS